MGGLPVRACVPHKLSISPGEIANIDLGYSVSVPETVVMNLALSRSVAVKHELVMVNGVGIITNGCTTSLVMSLLNSSKHTICIEPGELLGGLYFSPLIRPSFTVMATADSGD